LFSPLNLFVSGGLLVLGPLLFWAMTPRDGDDPSPQAQADSIADAATEPASWEPPPADTLERIERSPAVTWALGIPLFAALALLLARRGLGNLDIDTINLALWVLALLLHGRPHRFLEACGKGMQACLGIILQFPLYAGIMALMAASGLAARLTTVVSSVGAELLAPITFLSAGLLNLLVPSGGGQWAVQGPIIMEAARVTGVAPGTILMAMAYGDQWTNMLQPFWALPLLAVTGVRARDIVGYAVLWMIAGGAWIVLGLFVFG
jgi:short-chain fatty acids transporter